MVKIQSKQNCPAKPFLKKVIEEYIKNQIQEDLGYEQLSLKEYVDSFTGELVKKVRK